MQSGGDKTAYLHPTGYRWSSCGYCHGDRRASFGTLSSNLTTFQYQILLNRGWRRSGTYYYKPDARYSCCVHYTIRLDTTAFTPRKDQRQAINRFGRYILGSEYVQKAARFCPRTRDAKKRRQTCFELSEAVHEVEYPNVKRPLDTRTHEPIEPAHRFEVNLEPDSFTEEKYALFENYQRIVHREKSFEITRMGFKRFLCSGFGQSEHNVLGKERKLGSYHQCYRLDGKLVAIGVLDLLPDVVSSVYLLYHEDVREWNFGKLSALYEITLASEGGYRYYYMGYYIHSCIKMKYKAAFRPQQILDPYTNTWDLLSPEILKLLGTRRWLSMALERTIVTPNHSQDQTGESNLESVLDDVYGPDPGPQDKSKLPATVFQASMPGTMTMEEVRDQVDLGRWKLKLGNRLLNLEDLVSWDEHDISEPNTLNSICAELAACIGPDLVQQTALEFN